MVFMKSVCLSLLFLFYFFPLLLTDLLSSMWFCLRLEGTCFPTILNRRNWVFPCVP